jgi:hypothetical protein
MPTRYTKHSPNDGLGGLLTDVCDVPSECFRYETISFHGRLEILDKENRVAVFRRRQRIRFLEDGVTEFIDRVWGEGVLFAGYEARSMSILESIPTRRGYAVLLALPRMFARGETFDIITERRIVGGFIDQQAYWESAMAAPTEALTIDVRGPAGLILARPEIVAPARGEMDLRQRRRSLRFQVRQPALYIPYKLEWSWK